MGDSDEGSEREVHARLDTLKILQRHAELLRGLLLRPPALATNFGDAAAHILNDPLRGLAFHGGERRSR